MEMGEVIQVCWQYNTDLFDGATIARMAGHFQTLLEGIVANPHQRLSELPLLTAAERHQLFVEWNDTKAEYPSDKCVHQLFEAQVERSPDAVAVLFEDQQLTYRELNAKANQLAHYLQKLSVKPEVLVGICVQRSLEIVVELLGILKADRAYVSLDPAFPEQRLAAMLEDSQVPVLVIYTSGSIGTPKKSRSNTGSFSITSTASSKYSTCQMRVLPPFLPSPPTWATR